MAYMRDEKGLSISGSSDKKKLRYMGYFHGYKGYRFHNNPANTYAFNSFDEVQAIYDFDMAIKTMFWKLFWKMLKVKDLRIYMRNC